MSENNDTGLSMAKAAKQLGVTRETARRWAKSGMLKGAFRMGDHGNWYIRQSDLDKLIAERKPKQTEQNEQTDSN